jgi:hypothetical protein
MKNKTISILASLFIVVASNAAVTVSVIANSGAGLYLDQSGSNLSDGSLLKYGFFDEGSYSTLDAAAQSNFASVDALFTPVEEVFASNGEFLSLGNSFEGLTQGDQFYTWVFNSADGASASEWGIFSSSNALWAVPADNGTATLTTIEIDNVVVGGASGANYTLSAVPEPSAYAMLAGGFALGFAALRRRR